MNIKTCRNKLRHITDIHRSRDLRLVVHIREIRTGQQQTIGLLRREMQLQILLLIENIEQASVVILVHWLCLIPNLAPGSVTIRWQRTKRLQQVCHIPPTHMQPLQRISAVSNVLAQHDVQWHILRMPRHGQARIYILWPFAPLPATIVLHNQQAIRTFLQHCCRKYQRTKVIYREFLSFSRRRIHSFADGSIGILRITTRAAERIYAIVFLEILHKIKALSEAWKILRERQRIPTKLAETRCRNGHEVHLHVVQSYEHGFRQSGIVEQTFQVIHGSCWKSVKRIHVIVLGAQNYNLMAL